MIKYRMINGKKYIDLGDKGILYDKAKSLRKIVRKYIPDFRADQKVISIGYKRLITELPWLLKLYSDEILIDLIIDVFPYWRRRYVKRQHTETEWENKKEEYEYKCAYCGCSGKLQKDHVFPVSKGGNDKIENIVPCCELCNKKKRSKVLVDGQVSL